MPRRPGGLSLPLVAMPWAQLLGVPDASSATRLARRSLVLFLFSRAMAETKRAAQRPPLLAVPSLRRAKAYAAPQPGGAGT